MYQDVLWPKNLKETRRGVPPGELRSGCHLGVLACKHCNQGMGLTHQRSNSRKRVQHFVLSVMRFVHSNMTEHPQIGQLKCSDLNQYHCYHRKIFIRSTG